MSSLPLSLSSPLSLPLLFATNLSFLSVYPSLSIELGELGREEDCDLPESRPVPSIAALCALAKQAPPPAVAAFRKLRVTQPEPALGRAEVPGALCGAVRP